MTPHAATPLELSAQGSEHIAPDLRGQNFYDIDPQIQAVLELYLPDPLRAHLEPHLRRLGELAGGRLDELAWLADRHPPVLHTRDRFGRDEDWVEFHPAYREMEQIAFHDFGIHALARAPGLLGWAEVLPPLAKYAFQYLFVQAEFGLMCPISVTDTSATLIEHFANETVRSRFLPGMASRDPAKLLKSAQFMTEKAGGSDVGAAALRAEPDGEHWRLYGDKWFCSCADADVALLLARPAGAPEGGRGLALFLLPRRLQDGSRNAYRIVRLKDKLGTRSMASGEIVFEGAQAYLLGEPGKGLKQMLLQVNLSRLSHGVRAAGMMRRCWNESLHVARNRLAFGKPLIEQPLMRRQMLKLLVPTEQALSAFAFTAQVLGASRAGDEEAARLLRILTPLLKFRTARDNIQVATGAMEVRGGNGYIEDWVNARLVRDAHLGVLWEGTSNINALDAIQRAVRKEGAHETLRAELERLLAENSSLPADWAHTLKLGVQRAVRFAAEVAGDPNLEHQARAASSALYHAWTATLLAWEGARLGANGGDARRLLLSRLVYEHRLAPQDPLQCNDGVWERAAQEALLDDAPLSLEQATTLLAN